MTKVVLLCRVSTQAQDYERQVNELTDYCSRMDWTVCRVFANKVSGKLSLEEREEIQELIAYVKENEIDKVCCLEISRLGRNTLEALKVIQLLNKHKVSLFIKNYNLETLDEKGNVNPVASLITTILLEIASLERHTIIERMSSGREQYIAKCRETGKKMGRPDTYRKSDEEYKSQYAKEISLLRRGYSLRNTSKLTGTAIGTLRKLGKYL
jgi:DNA invertase Pin-like site-specific DNA recombinase